ncbi:hypothetical protein MED297_04954 [Reinekea sp. MED297]|uniref:Oxidoreductase molybdopterin-binding domain-containing protein n=2 Tax=Reinekea TaxID=230494 RepID=A4BIV4_9GAMM|nr:hypothetical protein MED297_04954 [Reinekea sp. MED297] [Reinekea blandensis MED297]
METFMKRPLIVLVLLSTLLTSPVFASDAIVLTIKGNNQVTELTMNDLLQTSQESITTATPFFEGEMTFQGPALKTLLNQYGYDYAQITLTALNDYSVTTDKGELTNLDPILAIRQNAQPMSVRDKGPIWVMLPLTEQPELNTPQYHRLMVWQLNRITLE